VWWNIGEGKGKKRGQEGTLALGKRENKRVLHYKIDCHEAVFEGESRRGRRSHLRNFKNVSLGTINPSKQEIMLQNRGWSLRDGKKETALG